MHINPIYRDTLQIVEENQLGPVYRLGDGAGWHPAVRNDWQTQDKLRGLLGAYRVVYTGSAGPQTWNYGGVVSALRSGASSTGFTATDHGDDIPGNFPKLVDQLTQPTDFWEDTNLVVAYNFVTDTNGSYIYLDPGHMAPPGWTNHDHQALNFWNQGHNSQGARNYLIDNFEEFLGVALGSELEPPSGYPVLGVLSDLIGRQAITTPEGYILSPANPPTSLYDHASSFSIASSDSSIREAAGYNIAVEAVYNFYPSTTPPYEEVIADSRIPEFMLPNVYYLQGELENTTDTLNAAYHLGALTLSTNATTQGPISWFNIGSMAGVTEHNADRYYDLYAEELQAFDFIDSNPTWNMMALNNKNFVVLHSDLDAIKEDRINTSVVPFYNRIVLGNDPDNRTGHESGVSILRELYDNIDTRDMVNMLQIEAVLALTGQANRTSSYTPFMESYKKVLNSAWTPLVENTSNVKDQKVLYDMVDLLDHYANTVGWARTAADTINDMSTLTILWPSNVPTADMPFRFIRDYKQAPEQLDCNPAQAAAATAALNNTGSAANLGRVTRTLEQIFNGANAHTETLLYVVRKKASPQATGSLQTFYISPEFNTDFPSVYIDAQVKYGKEYYYEIDRVALVFGNKYEYIRATPGAAPTSLENPPAGGWSASPYNWNTAKVKYSNVPSVKALLLPYTNGPIEAILEDRPPVPPEISFYPYKGINNKLKILLNSSTGKMSAPPVSILESDQAYFLNLYHSQTGDFSITTYDALKAQGVKLDFRSDDPVDAYELFRLDTAPQSYQSFAGSEIPIDPVNGIPGAYEDTIIPNTKHYYCARSLDIHGNRSNPTHIYEIEIVDNNGQIFVKQRVFSYDPPKEDFVKEGRRFIYIEPSFANVVLDPANIPASPSLAVPPPNSLLGSTSVDTVWGKEFKVRITSTKTGRKVDLNLTFKNTGIVNASE